MGVRKNLRWTAVSSVLCTALLAPQPGAGQAGAFAFQVRGGMAVSQSDFASGGSDWSGKSGRGPAFDMGFTLPVPGPMGGYLGFGQRWFTCDKNVCPPGSDWVSTGFDVALRQVIGKGRVRWWLQGGVHTHRLEGDVLDEEENPVPVASDPGLGFEVGSGLQIGLWTRTALSPGIRYGHGSASFRGGRELTLDYLVVDLGLVLGF